MKETRMTGRLNERKKNDRQIGCVRKGEETNGRLRGRRRMTDNLVKGCRITGRLGRRKKNDWHSLQIKGRKMTGPLGERKKNDRQDD